MGYVRNGSRFARFLAMTRFLTTPLVLIWFAFAALGLFSVGEQVRCQVTMETCVNDAEHYSPVLD